MNVLERLLATWAPHTCIGCGRDGRLLCVACETGLQRANQHCYRCQAHAGARTCGTCHRHTPLAVAAAPFTYDGLAKEMVGRLKFSYARSAADEMAALLRPVLSLLSVDARTLLVPVPTASSRVRQRGYDQAVLLARSLSRRSPARTVHLLERRGQSQQHGASRADRIRAAGRQYQVTRPGTVAGADILLIDDVLTTGATFETAARALADAGAKRVRALAFARAELGRRP